MSNREKKKFKQKPWQRNLVAKHTYHKGGFHGDTSSKDVRREAKIQLRSDLNNGKHEEDF